MAFLVFAVRKLFLKRKINDLSFRSIMLSQQRQSVTEKINSVMQSISQAKSSSAFAASSLQAQLASQFQKDSKNIFDPNKAIENAEEISDEQRTELTNLQAEYTNKQAAISMSSQMTNSIFESAAQAQLAPLNVVDSQISLEMSNIETQLKLLNPELESVEKAETEAAKQETPRFGLG